MPHPVHLVERRLGPRAPRAVLVLLSSLALAAGAALPAP